MGTLFHSFRDLALSPDTCERLALECGPDQATYRDFLKIVNRLAHDLQSRRGARPTVAIIAANCPYTLAIMLATWTLGGIVAPLDHHAPKVLMAAMLSSIQPDDVVVSTSDESIHEWVSASGFKLHLFTPEESSLPALVSRSFNYLTAPVLEASRLCKPEDTALYLYTSSASTAANLKAVPLTHEAVYSNCVNQLNWLRSAFPELSFNQLRVLGWAPWSHIMGISHDIGAHTFLTGGCLVFAIIPTSYKTLVDPRLSVMDIPSRLMESILTKEVDSFAGVPWALDGLMKVWLAETDFSRRRGMSSALKKFKMLIFGGAPASDAAIDWALGLGLNLVIGIGMTELAGPLFHARTIKPWLGWVESSCLVADAVTWLVDANGEAHPTDGEMYVKSRLISKGYYNYESTAFSFDSEGYITFRTGDLYSRNDGRVIWRGRTEDYIYMTSGEILDPRPLEKTLMNDSVIKQACVVGNKFMKGSSQHICAIIEVEPNIPNPTVNVLKAISAVNRDLAPPLRIAWPHVIVLLDGESIPLTRKKMIFRKKLHDVFAPRLAQQTATKAGMRISQSSSPGGRSFTPEQINDIVRSALSTSGISSDALALHPEATFSELGMTSSMAVAIVNTLNRALLLDLPLDTCHTFVDYTQLTAKVAACLGVLSPPSSFVQNNSNPEAQGVEVVVVGMACRLPGDINTAEGLWDALVDRRDDIMVPIPSDRWDHASFYTPNIEKPGDITHEKAGFINVDSFDNAYFGIPPAEALMTSPLTRLVLETAFEALENATIPASTLKGSNTGVFVAAGPDDGYAHLLVLSKGYEAYNRFYGPGMAISAASGRLSYLLDVHGPCMTVDTACSGGQVAFDLAVKHLQTGSSETALVCASNTHVWPGGFGFTSAQQMTSPDSRCAAFTIDANGYVPSEGAVSIVLKTRSAAIRDGDPILASVRSSVVKHDGRSQGLIAPNGAAQAALQGELLQGARMKPSDIDFIEAHGTGTALGDLIEARAINEVFQASHDADRPLFVGAAKSCIGHTEGAAGSVGILKAVLSFRNQALPGIVHLTDRNVSPGIDLKLVPLHLPRETVYLKRRLSKSGTMPYRAMVLAYGFAGTIAGTILESCHADFGVLTRAEPIPMLFVLSAKSGAALRCYLEKYLTFCRQAEEHQFQDICFSACTSRDHYRFRFACVAQNLAELINHLNSAMAADASPPPVRKLSLLFAFPGQGTQYAGMAAGLAKRYSGFKQILLDTAQQASSVTGLDIVELLLLPSQSNSSTIDQTHIAQVCIFVYQYCVCRWLEDLGLPPSAVMGHSLGEIAAAVISGALPLGLALRFVVLRGQVMRPDPMRPGAMVAISAKHAAVDSLCTKAREAGSIDIAVYNSSESYVVSGDSLAVELFIEGAKKANLRVVSLNVDQAFHSELMDGAVAPLLLWLSAQEGLTGSSSIPFLSSAFGDCLGIDQYLDAKYWAFQVRNPVKFSQLLPHLQKPGNPYFTLDIGPRPVLSAIIQSDGHIPDNVVMSLAPKKGRNEVVAFLSAMSALYQAGHTPNFKLLHAREGLPFKKIPLPTYPWQRQRFWPAFIPTRSAGIMIPELLNRPVASAVITKQSWTITKDLLRVLEDHTIDGELTVPGAALAAFVTGIPAGDCQSNIESLHFHMPLILRAESAGSKIALISGQDGSFAVMHGAHSICSGQLLGTPMESQGRLFGRPTTGLPTRIVVGDELYASFASVHFGSSFRNIKEIQFYESSVEAMISIQPSLNPEYDFIRQLDPCLHMMAALLSAYPSLSRTGRDLRFGAYLPSSLEGFVVHNPNLPSTFRCRYRFPLECERNYHVLSSSFEVVSLAGDLLVACKRYSVAWVPSGLTALGQVLPVEVIQHELCRYDWKLYPLGSAKEEPARPQSRLDTSVYFRPCCSSENDLCEGIAVLGLATSFTLRSSPSKGFELRRHVYGDDDCPLPGSYPNSTVTDARVALAGRRLLIVIDLSGGCTHAKDCSEAATWTILNFMKMIISHKFIVGSLVVVTSFQSAPSSIDVSASAPHTLLGSQVGGLIRVFGREMDLPENSVWTLDVPESLDAEEISRLLRHEFDARGNSPELGTIVQYRTAPAAELNRYILVLEPTPTSQAVSLSLNGVVVCTGMGSIAQALAKYCLASGSSCVVFLGRKPEDHEATMSTLSTLRASLSRGVVSYMQADVTDLKAVLTALGHCRMRFGDIDAIFHTAAVIKDATIIKLTHREFFEVLRPKADGAWNLHLASENLGLRLKAFVMMSSISVPFANTGQAAYVAGNSFMDSLAVYRRKRGLPGHSLQLGPWQSALIRNMDFSDSIVLPIEHEDGIPLMFKALATEDAVQTIARVVSRRLALQRWAARDPLFSKLVSDVVPNSPTSESTTSTLFGTKDVESSIRSCVSELAGVSNGDLDLQEPLSRYGIDSIAFAQLRGLAAKDFRVNLPITFLSDAYSLRDIMDHVIENVYSK